MPGVAGPESVPIMDRGFGVGSTLLVREGGRFTQYREVAGAKAEVALALLTEALAGVQRKGMETRVLRGHPKHAHVWVDNETREFKTQLYVPGQSNSTCITVRGQRFSVEQFTDLMAL